ncbi:MAG: CorA family divalent cation transporter [Thermoplasmata archaeon]
MFPTLIASLYGMNVGLPLQNSRHAFSVVILISIAWSGFPRALFRKLDWLL